MTKKELIEQMALEFTALIMDKKHLRDTEYLIQQGKDTIYTIEFITQMLKENDIQHRYLDNLVKRVFKFTKPNLIALNKRIDDLVLIALK